MLPGVIRPHVWNGRQEPGLRQEVRQSYCGGPTRGRCGWQWMTGKPLDLRRDTGVDPRVDSRVDPGVDQTHLCIRCVVMKQEDLRLASSFLTATEWMMFHSAQWGTGKR